MFHADRLRRFQDDPLPGQQAENPEGEIVDPSLDEEWEVDRVLVTAWVHRYKGMGTHGRLTAAWRYVPPLAGYIPAKQ